jgi:hypothetical protein
VDPSRLVFIDESGAKTNMTRLYGRAPRGQRVVEHAPVGHWCTTTMLCALRDDRIEAPLVIQGAMDSMVFRGYVEQMLVPTLRPGDVVVMDNLSPHKTKGVQEAIEAVGATVRYLPPYSPDFNPIEPMWSKVQRRIDWSTPWAMPCARLPPTTAADSSPDADIPEHINGKCSKARGSRRLRCGRKPKPVSLS